MPPNRRDALKALPLAAVPIAAGRAAVVADADPAFPGLTVRMQDPQNLEFPFHLLKSVVTPTEQFYVRNHFAMPTMDADAYRLKVEGLVETPLELTLADLKAMPAAAMTLTLECAGNGRVFLVPQVRGLQWQLGGVGTAEWAGVPLAAVLEKAKVKPGAVEVILVGADVGTIGGDIPSPGPIRFDRSIPLEKAMKPETLLAYSMNGEALAPAHGFPVRAVVGGWYGMAAVKWLTRIIVTDKPYNGFWQTIDYAHFQRRDGGLPTLVPVTAGLPKAQISRPGVNEVVPAGKAYAVRGAAWAGEERVAKVEVGVDGGKTWAAATLAGDDKPFCWRLWEFMWTPATPGPVQLVARCIDAAGRGQPEKRDPDRRTYMINHLVPVPVAVK